MTASAAPMTYDEFKTTWIWALRESALPILGVDPVEVVAGVLEGLAQLPPLIGRAVPQRRGYGR